MFQSYQKPKRGPKYNPEALKMGELPMKCHVKKSMDDCLFPPGFAKGLEERGKGV
ncbi:MAG: hypothetical protein HFI78_14965 [Lachnospiraceae bacterium]|jgi:hypothetical protein|nr:hypothetical protein [Lachnospiraceae bacterium]